MTEALASLIGVVVAALIAYVTARHTATKALAGVEVTALAKEAENDRTTIMWACDKLVGPSDEARIQGVVILTGLEDHDRIYSQGRTVIKAALRAHALPGA